MKKNRLLEITGSAGKDDIPSKQTRISPPSGGVNELQISRVGWPCVDGGGIAVVAVVVVNAQKNLSDRMRCRLSYLP